MQLEICASNFQSALSAQNAGAHRIELCSELAVGGVTPSYGLLKQVMQELSIPVFVLIRPRSGNFTYSDADFEIMKQDIQLCKELGCSGIVSGVLNLDQTIDVERTQELITLAKPMAFTFHRAFDWTPNPFEALETLMALKVDRILTSGQCSSAEKGILILNQLQKMAEEPLIILPGSGINTQNILIFKGAGFTEVHCSAVLLPEVQTIAPVAMNTPKFLNDGQEMASNPEMIRSMLQLIHD
ncbi:copper homeostasis protein CutC [Gelidibacter salicanalis]|uniref:PF03932 family protein CutC n=1 Tax=Gelidibacter salicanalis TaxID=291193 RepID=A0A5C7AFX9_9FLAO|nr:copper homeostasis protein CutC [Gelidibacter salicanalis]TXE07660.1 copper homeostasis protein CutC [Gelidibacter salicanalis]